MEILITISSANTMFIEFAFLVIGVFFTVLGIFLLLGAGIPEQYIEIGKIIAVGSLAFLLWQWGSRLIAESFGIPREMVLPWLFLSQSVVMIVVGVTFSFKTNFFWTKLANEIMIVVGILGIIWMLFPDILFNFS